MLGGLEAGPWLGNRCSFPANRFIIDVGHSACKLLRVYDFIGNSLTLNGLLPVGSDERLAAYRRAQIGKGILMTPYKQGRTAAGLPLQDR